MHKLTVVLYVIHTSLYCRNVNVQLVHLSLQQNNFPLTFTNQRYQNKINTTQRRQSSPHIGHVDITTQHHFKQEILSRRDFFQLYTKQ